jgi:hypothetical protein
LVNELLRLVLLAEIHNDLLDVAVAERLFGRSVLKDFSENYPSIAQDTLFIGEGDRRAVLKKRKISANKFSKAQAAVELLSRIPWLIFAGVTGSVAFGSADVNDDIDIFVVTEDGKLWLTRMMEFFLLSSGKRRTVGMKDVSDKYCVNAYISRSMVQYTPSPRRRRDVALELLMMKPLIYPFFYAEILSANSWIYKYYPCPSVKEKSKTISVKKNSNLGNRRGNIANYLAMQTQQMYMKVMRHPWRNVSMSADHAWFYDRKSWVARSRLLRERLEEYGVGGLGD